MRRICMFATIAAVLAAQQQAPPAPAKPKATQQKRATAAEKEVREFLGARIAYAKWLTVYFDKVGRQTIHVEAIGENQQILDVHSFLIGKPFGQESYNLVSARDVIESAESVALLKKCRFTKVIIRGADYSEVHMVR